MSRNWNAENRQKLREGKIKGFFAGPGESYPIAGPEDITHAFEDLHHSSPEKQAEVRARLISGAKEHGWESHIPADEVQKAMPGVTPTGGQPRTPQAAAYNSSRVQAEAHTHAAHNASRAAITTPTPQTHAAAAAAHNTAAQSHFTARTKAAAAGDQAAIGKHNQAMMQHNQQKAFHVAQQSGNEGGVRPAWNHQSVAKSEGEPPEAMTPEEVYKAQVHAHIRHLKTGKTVQVKDYNTARQVAHQNSAKAHEASGAPQVNHQAAAAAHRHAAQAHEAAEGMAHQSDATMHRAMAVAHNQHAQLHESQVPKGGDTGGDGAHRPEHLKDLEKHPDYQGFGYIGHSSRTPATDKAFAEAANKAGLSKHEFQATALGRAGRYIGDSLGDAAVAHHGKDAYEKLNEASKTGKIGDEEYEEEVKKLHASVPHEKLVEHIGKEIAYHTSGKGAKHSGVKEYAKDLEKRETEAKGGKSPESEKRDPKQK